ncbi:hypothetical protein [Rhizohabitans arisaemae]|uniref:hypothetical protein n=1 Tax=Rhizohabitans arisaemae TaxID=2720610 RepID=UPI0024B170E7|nr:hypothetical protein [Rhizohabitans arisaemae]
MDAAKGGTRRGLRTVLGVAHHVAGVTRLLDVLPLIEGDPRIHVAYTVPPNSIFTGGTDRFLDDLGAHVIPWKQAILSRFDLAVTAGQGLLQQLHAPIMSLSHGAGPNVFAHRWDGPGLSAALSVNSTVTQSLVCHGRVVPSAIMLGHEEHRAGLAQVCPDALPAAVVAGDPCFDRITASIGQRTRYRQALGVDPEHRLVVVTSTWGMTSTLGSLPAGFLTRLAAELPREAYRIVGVIHPNFWTWHGRRQVRSWHAECERAGVLLLPPEEGWRAALVAADALIGDHGSVTCYGAALGVPTLLASFPAERVVPGSVLECLGGLAPRLGLDRDLASQLDSAMREWSPDGSELLRGRLTSVPGQSAEIIRAEMYRLIGLAEPTLPAETRVVPRPVPFRDVIA